MSEQCRAGCGRPARRWHLCEVDEVDLAYGCLGKTRWKIEGSVIRVIRKWPEMRAYKCVVCSCWHAGHYRPGGTEEQVQRARAVMARLRGGGNGWLIGQLVDEWRGADRVAWKTQSWREVQS